MQVFSFAEKIVYGKVALMTEKALISPDNLGRQSWKFADKWDGSR